MNIVTAYRIAAVAEALSWTGLLAGMLLKHVVDAGDRGVQIFGPIHGGLFMAYVATTLIAARRLRWGPAVTLLALVASIPPFTTVAFERWATRREWLTQ